MRPSVPPIIQRTVNFRSSEACDTERMSMPTPASLYKGFRFPHASISHAVWLYFRCSLSYRDVEELLAERGIIVSYETIRQWTRQFGRFRWVALM